MIAAPQQAPAAESAVDGIVRALEQDGIAPLPYLVSAETLHDMQRQFALRLKRQRWNDVDGYERTERYRYMVQDVLTVAQGFVDVALHPLVKAALRGYIGSEFELAEAKGWKSVPTKRDFHGWHGDAWYDQGKVKDHIPREVKLALYLTDVKSGEFWYVKGSHGKQVPRTFQAAEVADVPPERIAKMQGQAGTAFLFDTSGIHRQSMPILEARHAVFLNYHDPRVPLQAEDVEYYRYHPLLLNAAFLGGLADDDYRILGFGNKTNYVPGFERRPQHRWFQAAVRGSYDLKLFVGEYRKRLAARLQRLLGWDRK
jgi:hypothetical protein